ncbi:hypothetical protein TB2_002467 [Malus domestica]
MATHSMRCGINLISCLSIVLIIICPDEQVQAFYEGLNDSNKPIVDSAYNGMLMKMSDEETIEMCEELAENSQQFNTKGRQAKRSAYAVNTNDGIQAEMAAMNKNIAALIKTLSPQSSQQALKFDKLEIQVGQLASAVNERQKRKFPSQPIANPKGAYEISSSYPSHEQVKSITILKSGTQVDNKVQMANEDRETNLKKNEAAYKDKPPFPQALIRPKKDNHFSEIMELFKKVHINIPLLEAIRQIPSYAKFLMGLCSHKHKLNGKEKVFLTKKLSDIYLWKNPSKL